MPAIIATHVHPGFQRGPHLHGRELHARDHHGRSQPRALFRRLDRAVAWASSRARCCIEIRAEQAEGRTGGAQLLIAGRGIGAPNAGPGNPIYAHFAYAVTTEAEIRKAVQEQAARKVDIIKIWVDDRGGRAPRISMPLARAAIDEAHKAGLKIAAHIFYHEDAVALAEAGLDLFAHLVRDKEMSDELIALDDQEQGLRQSQHQLARARHPRFAAAVGERALSQRVCCATRSSPR